MLNALKQAVQFGLDKKVHLAGARQRWSRSGAPTEAALGAWVIRVVLESAGRVPCRRFRRQGEEAHRPRADPRAPGSAMSRPGPARLQRRSAKSLKAVEWPRLCRISTCRGNRAGPESRLLRAGQNQLMATLFVGEARASGSAPEDLFKVHRDGQRRRGQTGPAKESGCRLSWRPDGQGSAAALCVRAHGICNALEESDASPMSQVVLFNVFNGLIVGAFSR